MAEAEEPETGAAGATDESLPGAGSEAGTPDQGDDQTSLAGLPHWTFSGLTEGEVADPAVEPPPPPPPVLTADQMPVLATGTTSGPPEPPPLPADELPTATVEGDSSAPALILDSDAVVPEEVAVEAAAAEPAAADLPEASPAGLFEVPAEPRSDTFFGAPPGAPSEAPPDDPSDMPPEALSETLHDAPSEPPSGDPASLLPPPPVRPLAPAAAALPALPSEAWITPVRSPSPGPWSSPAPIRPPAAPSLGPVGKRRRPAAVIALSVITLGIYSLAWHSRVNREMAEFDARLEVKSGVSALGVAIPWLLGVLTTLAGAADLAIRLLHVHVSLTLPSRMVGFALLGGIAIVPYLVLLLPFSVVALVMTLERLRVVQERVGIRPDGQVRPVARACLLLLPVIGGLWHLAAVQSRLNRVWREGDTAARPDPVRRPH